MKNEIFSPAGILVVLLIAGCLSGGCGEKKTGDADMLEQAPVVASWKITGADSLLVADAGLLKDTLTIPLSRWLDDFRMVRLDKRDEALVGDDGWVFFSDHYICIRCHGMPVKLFDREGKYLNDIGKIGQGPNEYSRSACEIQIDEVNGRVFLVPWSSRQILVYDLKGTACPSIPLAYFASKAYFRVDLQQNTVTVGTVPFAGNDCPVVWVQDLEGNVIREIDGAPFAVVPDFSNFALVDFEKAVPDFYIWRWQPKADSLYVYRSAENRLVPCFTLRFHGEKVPMHTYREAGSYIMGAITPGTVKDGSGMTVTLPPANYLVDKQSGKGAYIRVINDWLDNSVEENPIHRIRGNCWVVNYDPGNLLDMLKGRLAAPKGLTDRQVKTLRRLQQSITVDDNNILFFGTLKEGLLL